MLKASIVDKQDLTERESAVLQLICEGAVDKVIARQLAISIKTVEAHTVHIYTKLQVRQASINARCAAVGEAITRGMVKFLTVVLIISAVGLDNDQAARVGRTRLPSVRIVRVKSMDS